MENSFNEQMRKRTKQYALDVIRFYRKLPKNEETKIIGRQMFRSGTSVSANFRAACRAGRKREYYAKICVVVEENDETLFCLEIIQEAEIYRSTEIDMLLKETGELLAIFAKTKKNIKL